MDVLFFFIRKRNKSDHWTFQNQASSFCEAFKVKLIVMELYSFLMFLQIPSMIDDINNCILLNLKFDDLSYKINLLIFNSPQAVLKTSNYVNNGYKSVAFKVHLRINVI